MRLSLDFLEFAEEELWGVGDERELFSCGGGGVVFGDEVGVDCVVDGEALEGVDLHDEFETHGASHTFSSAFPDAYT
jgi:hypothetical protein